MGRPKKAVQKTKKVKLNKEQQGYAKLIKDVEKHLTAKIPLVEKLDAEIAKLVAAHDVKLKALKEKRDALNAEKRSLEAAKHNLMGVLSQIPPPKEWESFVKHVYEYHYYYHNCGCPNRPCSHFPLLWQPWWQWYNGGRYVYYPSWTQVYGPVYTDTPSGSGTLSGGLGSGVATSGFMTSLNSGSLTPIPSSNLNGSSVVLPSISNGIQSTFTNVQNVVHTTMPVVLNDACSSAFGAGNVSNADVSLCSDVTDTGSALRDGVNALQYLGFFDAGAPGHECQ